jgi:hypothetical protein
VLDKDPKGVVHGLTRDGADVGLHGCSYFVGRHVWSQRYGAKYRYSLRGCLDPAFAKLLDRTCDHAKNAIANT